MRQPAVRCREFVELVTDWEEGVLGDDEKVALEEHMAVCPPCVEYVRQLRLTRHDDWNARSAAYPASYAA